MADARQRQLTATPGRSKGEQSVLKKLALVAVCLAYPCASATAQDAKTVIANAQKALGDPKSITYPGSARDVAFQHAGPMLPQSSARVSHHPMRPIDNYVRVIDLAAPASRHTGATNNIGPSGCEDVCLAVGVTC